MYSLRLLCARELDGQLARLSHAYPIIASEEDFHDVEHLADGLHLEWAAAKVHNEVHVTCARQETPLNGYGTSTSHQSGASSPQAS